MPEISVGEEYRSYLSVMDFDLVSTVSGETSGDFTVQVVQDGVQIAPSVQITEVGTTGIYTVLIAAGFAEVGDYLIRVQSSYNGVVWEDVVNVRHQSNDIAALLFGNGAVPLTLTVVDSNDGNAPVVDALVSLYDSTGITLVSYGRTNSSGELELSMVAGTYVARVFAAGASSSDQEVIVDTVATEATLSLASIMVSPPSSPNLCRLYADFVTQSGAPLENFKVRVVNQYDPSSTAGLAVVEYTQTYSTDASGHVEFDVVRGTKVKVSFISTPWSREFVVPDLAVESLLTLFGTATDAFMVV